MRALLIAAAAAAIVTSTAAVAQQSTPPMMGQHMPGMMPMMDPSQHIEGRLAFLKTELRITDAQTRQWSTYADALRANAQRMHDLMAGMMSSGMMGPGMMGPGMMGQGMMGQGMMMGQGTMTGNQGTMMQGQPGTTMPSQPGTTMSLPDRLDWAERHMAAHMEMLQAIKGPTGQFYGALSDEQKRTADQILGPMGMMGMM